MIWPVHILESEVHGSLRVVIDTHSEIVAAVENHHVRKDSHSEVVVAFEVFQQAEDTHSGMVVAFACS